MPDAGAMTGMETKEKRGRARVLLKVRAWPLFLLLKVPVPGPYFRCVPGPYFR